METEPNTPRLTVKALIDACLDRGLLSEGELIGMLGETRHHLTLPDLERGLVRNSFIADTALGQMKAQIGGYLPLGSVADATRPDLLSREASRSIGAVVLDHSPLRVAIVEDLPASIERLRGVLGEFDVVAVTVGQFTELHKRAYTGVATDVLVPLEDIYQIFDEAVRADASDLHLSVGTQPSLRVNGRLQTLAFEPVEAGWMRSEIARIAGPQRLARLEHHHDVDMAFQYGTARLRVNFGADRRGLTVAARKIPTKIPTMDDLGLPRSVQEFINLDRGLVLVTGPTGAGKSTTLAAMLAALCQRHRRHVITLEDPIEFLLPADNSIVNQRELGTSFTGFPDGLRQALRQDPDVILVGEMRDLETVRTAVAAAETGHLVFATMHTFDAASTLARIVAMYPAEEQDQIRATMSYTLKGIVSQTLLPNLDRSNRLAAFEVMVTTPAIANNLRKLEGAVHIRSSIETGVREGMQTLDMALADLVSRRLVRLEDALEKASDEADLRRRVEM